MRHKASNKHRIRIGTSPYLKFGPEYLLLTPSPQVGWFFQERNCKGKPTQIAVCVVSLWYLQLWEFFIESPLRFNDTKNPVKFECYAEQFLTEGLNGQPSVVKRSKI